MVIKIDKKAMVDIGTIFWKQWGEAFFIILLLLGFVLSISIKSAILNYVVIFCAGLMAGRVFFKKKGRQPLFPFFLIIVGFLVGYMLGSFVFNTKLIAFLFILGSAISYYIHKKGYIP